MDSAGSKATVSGAAADSAASPAAGAASATGVATVATSEACQTQGQATAAPAQAVAAAAGALIACPECDLLQQEITLPPGGTALCQRCQAHLYRHTPNGMERALACTIAALILFFLANSFPIIGLELQKTRNATTLLGSVRYLFDHHLQLVAILVLMTTVIIPAIELFAMLAILLPLRLGRVPQGLPWLFRMVQWSHPWGMVEVFVLGIIVSLIRVSGFATVEPGVALFSFAGLMLLMTAGSYNFNRRELWAAVAAIKHA